MSAERKGRADGSGVSSAATNTDCPKCDGDGYTETWNDDQSGVVISVCSCQMLAQGIEEAWADGC